MNQLPTSEKLAYFAGATAVILAFLICEVISVSLDFWGLLSVLIILVAFDIAYFLEDRREKNAGIKKQI